MEHIFAELDSAMAHNVLNKKLFVSFFRRNIADWHVLLSDFDRKDADAFTCEEIDGIFKRLQE